MLFHYFRCPLGSAFVVCGTRSKRKTLEWELREISRALTLILLTNAVFCQTCMGEFKNERRKEQCEGWLSLGRVLTASVCSSTRKSGSEQRRWQLGSLERANPRTRSRASFRPLKNLPPSAFRLPPPPRPTVGLSLGT